eukprot:GHVN01030888.1.p1 GENE.GHVN01030888.1~~GHVN01030888.1.p1  ORF type:complete len:131 (+),score=20.20 GHVN01030888.1:563-955(+)
MCKAISLVIERHIYDLLIRHPEHNSLLNPNQHGCRWGVSTVTNLLLALDSAFTQRDLQLTVCKVFLDFAEAFHKVSHTHVIHKIRLCGVGGDFIMWIISWLVFRKQRVKVGGTSSALTEVTSPGADSAGS